MAKKAEKNFVTKVIDYKNVFNSKQGKRVLYDLMRQHHVLQTTFAKNDTPHEISFKEGARMVIIRILTLLQQDPRKLEQLIKEADEDAKSDQEF